MLQATEPAGILAGRGIAGGKAKILVGANGAYQVAMRLTKTRAIVGIENIDDCCSIAAMQ